MNTFSHFPIDFSMALAHNVPAFKSFLSLSDGEQDEIIEKAKSVKSIREMQILVNGLAQHMQNKNNLSS